MKGDLDCKIEMAQKSIDEKKIIEIYHGSENIIKTPEYGKGRPANDFGKGFYCTEVEALAKEWAASELNRVGYSNKYHLNKEGLNVVDLNSSKYHLLNWLAVLLKYRNFDTMHYEARENKKYILEHFYPREIDKADIVIGYRADDSYFSWAKEFLSDIISMEQLEKAMKFGELGNQIVLISEKSFSQIEFIGYEEVKDIWYHNLKVSRENRANDQYFKLKMEKKSEYDFKASDIREGGFVNDDFCLSKDVPGKGGR